MPNSQSTHKILEQTGSGRVFQQPSLILNLRDSVFTCPGASLNRVDVHTESLPADLLPLFGADGFELREISEAEWRERYHPELDHTALRSSIRPGDRLVAYSEVRLLDG